MKAVSKTETDLRQQIQDKDETISKLESNLLKMEKWCDGIYNRDQMNLEILELKNRIAHAEEDARRSRAMVDTLLELLGKKS